MTTLANLINRTRHDYLQVGKPTPRNKVNGALSDSDTTMTLTYALNTLKAGSKLSVELEDMYVWSDDASAKTAVLDRGEFGTTAAAISDGATVYVDALYSDAQIMRALNAAVSQLVSEGIFQASTVELTKSSSVNGYDLTSSANYLGVIDANWENTVTAAKQWHRVRYLRDLKDANTSDFASGTGILVDDSSITAGATIRVTYKHELVAGLSALADVVETATGLEADAMDLLCIAAALHLTAGKEIERNERDAQRARRNNDTPAGAWSQADSNLATLYRSRVRAERQRLQLKYPVRLA